MDHFYSRLNALAFGFLLALILANLMGLYAIKELHDEAGILLGKIREQHRTICD
jgi:hypothetical protein